MFVFERVTGKPLFKINEVPAPKSILMSEQTWSTQPVPTKPVPMARQLHTLTEKDISPYAENREELIAQLKTYQTALFASPSKEGAVILSGYDGGPVWDGATVNKEGIMYVNCNEMAWILKMKDTPKQERFFCRSFWH